ncbi:hypothetical protein CHF27_000520 [Romboutsia maritimum]|uniref:DUF3159 domain-containing protein n=1 Tax=Romboutsia maritimum TaxID=2020948 RepID=A0A371IW64_9FIRM|nr:hypothetical protein [Romboutsia maritimum]RDY24716.1 hypothetical protein CHF27_000520 [Romboutsia maritimum]
MKYRIIFDIMIYIMAPVLLGSMINVNYLTYFIMSLASIGLFYTTITKFKQDRINVSGLVFMALSIVLFIFKSKVNLGFDMYVYNTFFLILGSVLISLIGMFGKNICNYIYKDILNVIGYNDLNVAIIVKKNELEKEFNKLSSLVMIHMLALIFIRVYSIVAYGVDNYLKTSDLENLTSILLIMGEIYLISKIISKPKNKVRINKKKNKSNYKQNEKKVINLNQYKNVNK